MPNLLTRLFRREPEITRYTVNDYINWLTNNGRYGLTQPYGMPVSYARGKPAERIENSYEGYTYGAYKANPIVYGVMRKRASVFSEARFVWRREGETGRPGDLYADEGLSVLRRPWPNGTTGELLARMIQDGDLAGNFYATREGDRIRRLRPDWVQIVLSGDPRTDQDVDVVGYVYTPGGPDSGDGRSYLPDEICHWSPDPDPDALYRGMSWLTPVVREIQGDSAAMDHKIAFFRNGATLGPIVKVPAGMTAAQFKDFVDAANNAHQGVDNAYRPMYVGGGADVTLQAATMQQLDFKALQGASETRICVAGQTPAVIAGVSEGLAGSSLNAGNYQAAKRAWVDGTLRPLWRSACAALSALVDVPADAELWFDERDIAFLRDDEQDIAQIQQTQASTVSSLITAGFKPESSVDAVVSNDFSKLEHTGLTSVQLMPPGSQDTNGDGVPDAEAQAGADYEAALDEFRSELAWADEIVRKFDPDQPRAAWVGGVGGQWSATGALRDALNLAGRIDLDPGEEFVGSDKIKTDYASVRLAATQRDGRRLIRLGLGDGVFGGRDDEGGPWRGRDTAAEENARRAPLLAEYLALQNGEGDMTPAEQARFDALEEMDLNEINPSGHTARLDEASAARLRAALAEDLAKALQIKAAEDARFDEIDRLEAQRKPLRHMDRKWTDAEEARWDELTAKIEALEAADPYPKLEDLPTFEGSVPGEWADVHYRVEYYDNEVNATLGAIPHGSGETPSDLGGNDETASLDAAEVQRLIGLLDRALSREASRSHIERRDFYGQGAGERVSAGHVGGGRFRKLSDQITAALNDWLNGEGPDDPLPKDKWSQPQLKKAAEQLGIAVPPRSTHSQLRLALLNDAKSRHRGERAAGTPKPVRMTLQSSKYRDLDVGVYREANGKVGLYRLSPTSETRGSKVASFDDLEGLEAWGRDNGEPKVAEWAASERGAVKPTKRAPAKKANLRTKAGRSGLIVDAIDEALAGTEGNSALDFRIAAGAGSNREVLQGMRDRAAAGTFDDLDAFELTIGRLKGRIGSPDDEHLAPSTGADAAKLGAFRAEKVAALAALDRAAERLRLAREAAPAKNVAPVAPVAPPAPRAPVAPLAPRPPDRLDSMPDAARVLQGLADVTSRETARDRVASLKRQELAAIGQRLGIPAGLSSERLRDEIVEATVGRRLDAATRRGFAGDRPEEATPFDRNQARATDIVDDAAFAAATLTDSDDFPGDFTFRAIARRQGFDGPPTVVSREQMDRLVADGRPAIFRGVSETETDDGPMSAAQLQEQMRTGPYVPGEGFYGSGFYFGDNEEDVAEYYSDRSEGSVARATLKSGARVVDHDTIQAEWEQFQADHETDGFDPLRSAYGGDLGRYAAGRGYDAIQTEDGIYVVLNRTAMIVEGPPAKAAPRKAAKSVPAKASPKPKREPLGDPSPLGTEAKKLMANANGRYELDALLGGRNKRQLQGIAGHVGVAVDDRWTASRLRTEIATALTADPGERTGHLQVMRLNDLLTEMSEPAVALDAAHVRGAADGWADVRAAAPGRSSTATAAQREALHDYKSDDHFREVNDSLFSGTYVAGSSPIVDGVRESMRPLTDDVVVWRGGRGLHRRIPGGSRKSGLDGAEWTRHDFASTSTSERVALDFATNDDGSIAGGQPTVMRIRVPAGTPAVAIDSVLDRTGPDDISRYLDEEELILADGLRYRIARDYGVVRGVRRLDVEVVQNSGPTEPPKKAAKRTLLADPAAKIASLRALGDVEAVRDDLDLHTVAELKTLAKHMGGPQGQYAGMRKREFVDALAGMWPEMRVDEELRRPTKKTAAPKVDAPDPEQSARDRQASSGRADLLGDGNPTALAVSLEAARTPQPSNGDELMSAIAQRQGFDGRPTVVPFDEWDTTVGPGYQPLFRGVANHGTEAGAEAGFAEELRNGEAFFPTGVWGSGIYTSVQLHVARRYGPDPVRMALRPDARIAEWKDLEPQHKAFLASLPPGDPAREVFADPGRYAAARGYDAMRITGSLEDEMLVFNRSALLVREVRGAGGAGPKADRPGGTGRDLSAETDFAALPPEYNREDNTDPALGEILRRQGFDRPPAVVSGTDFDAALRRGEVRETWRGYASSPYSDLTPEQMAEQYRTGDAYSGVGINGNGTYVAIRKADGEYYGPTLLRIGLRTDARVISADDLDAEMDAYFATAPDLTRQHRSLEQQLLADLAKAKSPRARANLRRQYRSDVAGMDRRSRALSVQRDPGRFAALRGYDAIEIPKERSPDKHAELIILNRGATIVEAAE